LLHEVSKRKESEHTKNVALLNKTHKANEKLCFYCKKPGHFVRNCLKKKSDEKEKANQACEDQEPMFVAALSANDHTAYHWIINSSATQYMTFEREWFTTYESILPRKVYMGDDTILEAIGKGSIKATMQVILDTT
jgi:PAB1-binding protein PBP1